MLESRPHPPEIHDFVAEMVQQDFVIQSSRYDPAVFGNWVIILSRGSLYAMAVKDRGIWLLDVGRVGHDSFSVLSWIRYLDAVPVRKLVKKEYSRANDFVYFAANVGRFLDATDQQDGQLEQRLSAVDHEIGRYLYPGLA